jgi:hypothetical protein
MANRKKDKNTNNSWWNMTKKSQYWVIRTPLKMGGELWCYGRVSSSCSTGELGCYGRVNSSCSTGELWCYGRVSSSCSTGELWCYGSVNNSCSTKNWRWTLVLWKGK